VHRCNVVRAAASVVATAPDPADMYVLSQMLHTATRLLATGLAFTLAGATASAEARPPVAAGSANVAMAPAATRAMPPAASRVAQSAVPARQRVALPDTMRSVFLVTFGPGAATWERFGHNAIWIHDPESRSDVAYHYGLFDMSEEGFLVNFLRGRMRYRMGDADALRLIDAYRAEGRDVWVQRLNLTAAQAEELQSFLEWNLQPDHRSYLYDYFRDNCSTRVRDALDDALGGELARQLTTQSTASSFRSTALDLTARDALLTAGMDVGLGQPADQRLTGWDAAYIPMELRDYARRATVRGPNGDRQPLVLEEWSFAAEGEATGTGATRWIVALLIGLAVGGSFALLARRVAREGEARMARAALAIAGGTWGVLIGLLGLILFSLWVFTDHTFAHWNENLLQASPLALLLAVALPAAALGRRPGAARFAAALALVLAALSVIGLVAQLLPALDQANGVVLALLVPAHLGVAWAAWRLRTATAPAVRRAGGPAQGRMDEEAVGPTAQNAPGRDGPP